MKEGQRSKGKGQNGKSRPWLVQLLLILSIFSPALASGPQDSFTQAKAVAMANETIGRKVGNYTLIDQDGKRFNLEDLVGRPFIVSFIYTSCPHICPAITGSLARVMKGAGDEVTVLTVGFDTEKDTHQRMREYGERFANLKNWIFATSDKETIERMTRDFGFYYQKAGEGFDHLNMITIVDATGRISRHIYGLEFKTEEILAALKGSDKNSLSQLPWLDRLKLFCYRYNETTKTYEFDYPFVIGVALEGITILIILFLVWGKEIRSGFARLVRVKSVNVR
ncbi:MAG: SCO family protein [Deltaproteobacteria bacterium]|nr:SCO family protein [Deltaproteobacteria bacterium]